MPAECHPDIPPGHRTRPADLSRPAWRGRSAACPARPEPPRDSAGADPRRTPPRGSHHQTPSLPWCLTSRRRARSVAKRRLRAGVRILTPLDGQASEVGTRTVRASRSHAQHDHKHGDRHATGHAGRSPSRKVRQSQFLVSAVTRSRTPPPESASHCASQRLGNLRQPGSPRARLRSAPRPSPGRCSPHRLPRVTAGATPSSDTHCFVCSPGESTQQLGSHCRWPDGTLARERY